MLPLQNRQQAIASETKIIKQDERELCDGFEVEKPEQKPQSKVKGITEFLESKVVNPKDINDSVTMPRAIFKGYLCFTAGMAIGSVASTIKDKPAGKILNAVSAGLSVLGTYNFVKPFIYKGETNNAKEK